MAIHKILTDLASADWIIPDPGTGTALPNSKTGMIAMTTGTTGETNTLADPVKEGLMLTLVLVTDGGGDRVVTVATDVSVADTDVLTFADAGDWIQLFSIPKAGGGFKWALITYDGVAFSGA